MQVEGAQVFLNRNISGNSGLSMFTRILKRECHLVPLFSKSQETQRLLGLAGLSQVKMSLEGLKDLDVGPRGCFCIVGLDNAFQPRATRSVSGVYS